MIDILINMIEPFVTILALLPLIGYLTVLATIRLSGRVLVTTGGRDIAALGIAISGLLAAGPAELFFPVHFAMAFGPFVWVALALFYALCVALIALTSTPKLVVYGRTPDELYAPLLRAAERIDPAATGENGPLVVRLPSLGIQLRIDGQRGVDYAQVVAFEPGVSMRFWSSLLGNLRAEVRHTSAPMPRRGYLMLVIAACFCLFMLMVGVSKQELVVEGFREWLWR